MLFGLDAIPLTEARAGVGRYTLELARSLAALSPADEFELAYPSSYKPINLADEEGPAPPNLSEARVSVGALGRRWWSVGLPRYAARRRLDLFHGTNYEVPLWGSAARVVTVHDLSLLTRPETHERRRVARARVRLPMMARAADAVVVPTEAVRREACERLGLDASKVFTVHEAAGDLFRPLAFEETEGARRRLGVGDEFLLSVGTLEPRKNLPVLLRAFEEVLRARPASQLRLVLAGRTGWLAEPFLAAVADSPARPRVVLTGYLKDDDLRSLYASCRAFVYPSVYEGFGLPPLEAMSCAAPVVAGRGPALEEVAGDAARLFDPANAEELARILLELLDDAAARRTLSDAGTRRARDFSWEKTARLTLDVYAEAMRRKKGRPFTRP
ncbi:MAG TPA: glycosyltransferase family 1 protein [Pyrinomonadaceae bacterium]|nr:glycosyltransferase family 1 protein [Pyrinomonadaceae bacterium]